MSHQPFETWIFEQATLDAEDRRTLQAHLDTCEHCRKLQKRWQPVQLELRAQRMAAPAPGFTRRWRANLAERRAHEQRKHAWKAAGLLMGAAMFVLFLMAVYTASTTSITDWMIAAVNITSSTSATINLGIHFVQGWFASTPLVINIALWIYLAVGLCSLTFVWVLVLWRTNLVGVFNR